MTLKERFQQWFINDVEEHYEGTVEEVAIEHEKVADEFAIEFAEWTIQQPEVKIIKKSGLDNSYMRMSSKELLEIYKKEKGL
jgi:hypothetical protein